MTAPINPIPIGQTASYTKAQQLSAFTTLEQFGPQLAALDTVILYIDPNKNVFHLNGPRAGKEGVVLGPQIQGEQHIPFTQVLIRGAFQIGATIQRTNYDERLINFRIQVGGNGFSNYTYRMCEERWWNGQDETQPGWLGVFTRLSGWRWTQVYPAKTVDTAQAMDPVTYGNNFAVWDINWIAPYPFYAKPALSRTWSAATAGPPDKNGFYSGNLVLANRGDLPAYVYYLINGAGYCQLQDNNSAKMVALPEIFPTDGVVLCQTDPAQQTLTAVNDPQDNEFYGIARASGLLNFLLAGAGESGEPVWQRGYVRFVNQTPGQSATHYTVMHTNPNATVTAILPQYFRRSR